MRLCRQNQFRNSELRDDVLVKLFSEVRCIASPRNVTVAMFTSWDEDMIPADSAFWDRLS